MKPPQGSGSTSVLPSAVTNLLFPPGGKVVYIMIVRKQTGNRILSDEFDKIHYLWSSNRYLFPVYWRLCNRRWWCWWWYGWGGWCGWCGWCDSSIMLPLLQLWNTIEVTILISLDTGCVFVRSRVLLIYSDLCASTSFVARQIALNGWLKSRSPVPFYSYQEAEAMISARLTQSITFHAMFLLQLLEEQLINIQVLQYVR